MAIIRVLKDKHNPYVMVNKNCLREDKLTWKAKGIHTYLLSLPDEWQIYISDLKNRSKDGKDSTAQGITELEKAGYIKRKKIRNEKGQFKGYEYEVYEFPIENTENGKAETENPSTENPSTKNPSLINNNINNKELKINNEKTINKEIVNYSDKLLGEIGPNNKIKLLDYLEDGLEKEVIIKAIDIAVASGNRNFNYVQGVLNNWLRDNIKTIIEVEDHLQKFNKKKSKGEVNGKYKEYAKHLDRENKATISDEETRRAAEELGIEL